LSSLFLARGSQVKLVVALIKSWGLEYIELAIDSPLIERVEAICIPLKRLFQWDVKEHSTHFVTIGFSKLDELDACFARYIRIVDHNLAAERQACGKQHIFSMASAQ
jgi:hypothetical protein